MNLRKSLFFYLACLVLISAPTATLVAAKRISSLDNTPVREPQGRRDRRDRPFERAQDRRVSSRSERAFNLIKSIYTLDYLDGDNGKYRTASLFQKIVRQPGRAIATATVYGLTFMAAKKLYDFADKQGVFEQVKAQANRAAADRAIKERYKREQELYERQNPVQDEPLFKAPDAAAGQANDVRIANPMAGRRLNVLGIRNLPGFYHMHSRTPYRHEKDSCGVNAAYNMAQVEANLFGRAMNDAEFERVRQAAFPAMGRRGANNEEVADIMERLRLAPVIALAFNGTDEIERLGHVDYRYQGGERERRAAAAEAPINAAYADVDRAAHEFRRARGARVAHFLCGVPGHWIAISVTRNAQGEQAMYLYDNLNERPHRPAHMQRHIEHIYHRFF